MKLVHDKLSPLSHNMHTNDCYTTDIITLLKQHWLVDSFVFNDPFDNIPVCIGLSSREREEEERNDRREKKCPNNPHPHPLQEL